MADGHKWVYTFGDGKAEGSADLRNLLGGKGANLAEMSNLGLPVPPGFTITTEVCTAYYDNNREYPDGMEAQAEAALAEVGKIVGAGFGDEKNPLLVSVRSGARASMPGMMDTVLNLGLNDVTVKGLAEKAGDERFAYDSYRRFIQMYSDVVMGLDHHAFEEILDIFKEENEYYLDTDLSADDWKEIITRYKKLVKEELEQEFPQDVTAQLWGAIGAVFGSWQNTRAKPTAVSITFPMPGAPPSTSRRWSSAIWARPAQRASPSPVIPRRARRRFTASSSSMRRARTWWPASARRKA